ncbi:unnamed protein product [Polarella glacialis]|uniref:Dynein heavy chain coiled coil stalk domain-containing protein n=1 Tax=Polarella glacialis TaxID=89957 RepID=A0A813IPR3_POLGL|nr:unnamed protein product [Polarella glacialis]
MAEPPDLDSLAAALAEAENATYRLNKNNYTEAKALGKPPGGMSHVIYVFETLQGKRSPEAGADADGMTFGSSATTLIVLWASPCRTQDLLAKELCEKGLPVARLEAVQGFMKENPQWTAEFAEKRSLAAGALSSWCFAAVAYLEGALAAEMAKGVPKEEAVLKLPAFTKGQS